MPDLISDVIAKQRADIRQQHPRSAWEALGIEPCSDCGGTGEDADLLVPCFACRGTGRADCEGA